MARFQAAAEAANVAKKALGEAQAEGLKGGPGIVFRQTNEGGSRMSSCHGSTASCLPLSSPA